MKDSIFLSASVPDVRRSPEFAETADSVAISAAVSALVFVILGRRPLVWGGHPAITPMVWTVAEDIDVDYAAWVRLYQSRYFVDEFPEENEKFRNVVYTNDVAEDRERSLLAMREKMFTDHGFSAAVFIGGMDGIFEEFELFQSHQSDARVLPVASTGGAALELAAHLDTDYELRNDLDFVALFHRHLGVSTRENRYFRPDEQPNSIDDRLWRKSRRTN